MDSDQLLIVLMELAVDMGYRIEKGPLLGVGAKTTHRDGTRVLLIDDSHSIPQRIRWVARCIQNDPQLSCVDLTAVQEAALQEGSRLAQESRVFCSPESNATLEWPAATSQRKAS